MLAKKTTIYNSIKTAIVFTENNLPKGVVMENPDVISTPSYMQLKKSAKM